LNEVPSRLAVIGGGYIGLELGSVWSRLGSEVTVIEYLDRIAPGIDVEVSLQFQKILQKQGLKFILNSEVLSISRNSGDLDILMKDHKSGEEDSLQSDIALVSTGRKPYVDGLFSEDPIINIKDNGFIDIDKHFRTSVEGIWAIGDVVEGPMLAHKAEEEGIAVAELIAGKPGHVNYNIIPSVIYTNPEVASVGMSEEQLQSDSVDYKVGKFPFLANGRAKVNKTTEGFVKVLSSSETDQILGVHIIGEQAGTMIGEAVVAMEFEATSEDLARICHAHPTLSEAIKEAALSVEDRAIHM
jgi:dihydrolipoamide dehydrogenase